MDAFGHTPETYLNEASKLEQKSPLREINTEKQFLEAKLIFSNPYLKNKTTLKI